jgi:hypothetical protein
MIHKNIDGIRAFRKATPQKITYVTPLLTPSPTSHPKKVWSNFTRVSFILFIGLITVVAPRFLTNHYSVAETEGDNELAQQSRPENVSLPGASEQKPNSFFTTAIALLPEYQSAVINEEQITERKAKLKIFLENRKSPFAEDDIIDTIARQPHWRLILAVANAESSLGKHCVDQNCSGIGVAPGHELWRKYKSIQNWVLDLNRLLERRYSDKTLEQMCGVYVQPCNQNWLLATSQIFDELKAQNIE